MFISRIFASLARLMAAKCDESVEAPRPAERLEDKLARWRRQAIEYERLGCRELARHTRESIRTYERELAAQAWRRAA